MNEKSKLMAFHLVLSSFLLILIILYAYSRGDKPVDNKAMNVSVGLCLMGHAFPLMILHTAYSERGRAIIFYTMILITVTTLYALDKSIIYLIALGITANLFVFRDRALKCVKQEREKAFTEKKEKKSSTKDVKTHLVLEVDDMTFDILRAINIFDYDVRIIYGIELNKTNYRKKVAVENYSPAPIAMTLIDGNSAESKQIIMPDSEFEKKYVMSSAPKINDLWLSTRVDIFESNIKLILFSCQNKSSVQQTYNLKFSVGNHIFEETITLGPNEQKQIERNPNS